MAEDKPKKPRKKAPKDKEPSGAEVIAETLISIAESKGVSCLELKECPQCKLTGIHLHAHEEVLTCDSCGCRFASSSPRRPQTGEVTLGHLERAIEVHTDMASELVHGECTMKIETLPLNLQKQMIPHAAKVIRTALSCVLQTARKLAGEDK